MEARDMKVLVTLRQALTNEKEILYEEINTYNVFLQKKRKRLDTVSNELLDVEYEMKNHPDSLWDAANNAYEMRGDR